jgi:hypothetical protein
MPLNCHLLDILRYRSDWLTMPRLAFSSSGHWSPSDGVLGALLCCLQGRESGYFHPVSAIS